MALNKITLTTDDKLSSYLDTDDSLKCLITLEDENVTNILLFKSIFDVLTKSTIHNLTFGISPEYAQYVTLFESESVKCMVDITDLKSYDYLFTVPKDTSKPTLKKNVIRDLNRKYIGLSNVVFLPTFVSVQSHNKDSDTILIDFDKTEDVYSNIKSEVEARGLELLNINDIGKTKSINKVSESLDIVNNNKAIGISGSGYIPFSTEFSIQGTDLVQGKIYPQSSSILKYVNKTVKKKEEVEHTITGKGMVEYDFTVNVLSNEISIEIHLNDFSIKSGISDLVLTDETVQNTKGTIDKQQFRIDSLLDCKYYMGTTGENLLLAYSVLGIDNCILLTDANEDDYFKNTKKIHIDDYDDSSTGDLLEDMYALEV